MNTVVKINRYYEMTGDTADAFQKKVKKGIFIEDIHFKVCDDGVKWVDLQKINEWYEIGTARQLAKYAKQRAG